MSEPRTAAGRTLVEDLRTCGYIAKSARMETSGHASTMVPLIEAETREAALDEVRRKVERWIQIRAAEGPPSEWTISGGYRTGYSAALDDLLAIIDRLSEPRQPSHDITDPSAPVGWQCGDANCRDHGFAAHGLGLREPRPNEP